jgi:ABC-type nitrate/sulfonate/bicarbonate transport system permease component
MRVPPTFVRLCAAGAVLAIWQLAWDVGLLPRDAVPAPLGIVNDIWSNREPYASNLAATLFSAGLGYLVGNVVAVAAGILFVWRPAVERMARGLNLIVFAIPAIALGPLLAIAFQGILPQVILAAISVYFTTMTVTTVGLREAEPDAVALVRLYGAGDWSEFRWVRLRSALPSVMSGLRAGATSALLGAILAEFGSGAPGLGSFMLASMSLGQPERVWGIATLTTTTSLLVFGGLSLIAARITWRPISTLGTGSAMRTEGLSSSGDRRTAARPFVVLIAILLPFGLWQAIPYVLNLSPAVVQTPTELWSYLVTNPDKGTVWAAIGSASQQTVPLALVGMVLGGAAALALALACKFFPILRTAVMAPVLVLQSTPLVALTVLIILMLGRGTVSTMAISTSVCFYPAFITLSQALESTPAAALDLVRLYGAAPWQTLCIVTLPYLTPFLFTAARLVAPTALLGVMTAEWLATGDGYGGLMNEARGSLDYGMIWTVAFITVAAAAGLYQLILTVERFVRHRRGD